MGSKQDSLGGNDGEDVGGGAATRGIRADRPFLARNFKISTPSATRERARNRLGRDDNESMDTGATRE